jgi:hypothetical protein
VCAVMRVQHRLSVVHETKPTNTANAPIRRWLQTVRGVSVEKSDGGGGNSKRRQIKSLTIKDLEAAGVEP